MNMATYFHQPLPVHWNNSDILNPIFDTTSNYKSDYWHIKNPIGASPVLCTGQPHRWCYSPTPSPSLNQCPNPRHGKANKQSIVSLRITLVHHVHRVFVATKRRKTIENLFEKEKNYSKYKSWAIITMSEKKKLTFMATTVRSFCGKPPKFSTDCWPAGSIPHLVCLPLSKHLPPNVASKC